VNVVVVGLGAIGTLTAVSLARAGAQVAAVVREHHLSQVRSTPLTMLADLNLYTAFLTHADASLSAVLEVFPADVVVVTVKAYDTDAVAEDLARADVRPFVLSLQNGVGNEERFVQVVGPDRVLAGVISTPVDVVKVGHVRVARSSYKIGLAAVRDEEPARRMRNALGQAFVTVGFRVQYADDYQALKWTKLLLNLTANAQSALLGWPPGRVFAHPIAGTLEVRAWREALAVMRALGVRVLPFGGYPLPWVTPLIEHLPVRVVRLLMGRFARGGRGNKMPSVYLDLERGRQRTEVPWLNGAVARYGEQVGVPTPVNATLDALVAAVASGRLDRSVIRGHPEYILAQVRQRELQDQGGRELRR